MAVNDNKPDRLDVIVSVVIVIAAIAVPGGIIGAWALESVYPLIATVAGVIFFLAG